MTEHVQITREVKTISSADQSPQPAMFYAPSAQKAVAHAQQAAAISWIHQVYNEK